METAAYFVVSEAVTNAAEHSTASAISVDVRQYPDLLVVQVEDNGIGGADMAGSGLNGPAGRVDALDGRLHVHSPPPGAPPRSSRSCRARNAGRGLDSPAGSFACSSRRATTYARRWARSENAERVGYLLKDRVAQVEEFLDALERIHAGSVALDPEVVRQLVFRTTHVDPLARLTPRERSVLEELVQGYTNAAISEKLHISTSAVEKNLNAVFDKLGLPRTTGYNRRILAVPRYPESWNLYWVVPPGIAGEPSARACTGLSRGAATRG